ncbi:MAG: TIM barrel protein [Saccharofermentanales bacterium]|jgi:xylose isomerase
MSRFKFSVGPWNVANGVDVYGPCTRDDIPMKEKIKKFAELGFDAIQFHDDDVVPNISSKTEEVIIAEAKELRSLLDELNLKAEFVAPRLWFEPQFKDGAYTAPKKENWEHAMWRSYRSIDIANILGCDLIVLWFAREGTLCMESKPPVNAINQLTKSLNLMLEYDPKIRLAIEPKPNEPIDRSYAGTVGHAIALGNATIDPDRVGVVVESAHSTMVGLEPAHDMAFAIAQDKLFSVHLNDQNGIKYDQDKIFGAENLRSAFNQIKVLCDHNYCCNGEYLGLDVKSMRSTGMDYSYDHLANSLKLVKLMEDKVDRFDQAKVDEFVKADNYEGLEMYILELLLTD